MGQPRTLHVVIRQGRQRLDEADLFLDPGDTAALLTALRESLGRFGIDHPDSRHRIQVYKNGREWVREVRAA